MILKPTPEMTKQAQ